MPAHQQQNQQMSSSSALQPQTAFEYGQSFTSTDCSIPPFLEFTAAEMPALPPKYVYGIEQFNQPYERPFISDKPCEWFKGKLIKFMAFYWLQHLLGFLIFQCQFTGVPSTTTSMTGKWAEHSKHRPRAPKFLLTAASAARALPASAWAR
jgi:hypothetical protein